jgi:hypothetical protein
MRIIRLNQLIQRLFNNEKQLMAQQLKIISMCDLKKNLYLCAQKLQF